MGESGKPKGKRPTVKRFWRGPTCFDARRRTYRASRLNVHGLAQSYQLSELAYIWEPWFMAEVCTGCRIRVVFACFGRQKIDFPVHLPGRATNSLKHLSRTKFWEFGVTSVRRSWPQAGSKPFPPPKLRRTRRTAGRRWRRGALEIDRLEGLNNQGPAHGKGSRLRLDLFC